jgi:hypothetical protein
MNKTVEFCGYLLTSDEVEACKLLLKDIREKKERERLINKAKMSISFEISNAISEIGLETTKNIVRELNRELRELTADE